jgi:hypothetical protein
LVEKKQMKKKIISGLMIIFGLIFLVGCGKQEQETVQQQGIEQANQQATGTGELNRTENENFQGGALSASLKELMNMGQSMKCDWTINDGDETGSGTVYIDGEKFREDLITTSEEGEESVYVISDGDWIYQWSSSSKEGTKMQLSEIEKINEENESIENTTSNNAETEEMMEEFNEKFDYQCEKWEAETSLFDPPADIQFSDMTEFLKNAQKNSRQIMQNMCQMCESLPAEAKAECLKNCQQ